MTAAKGNKYNQHGDVKMSSFLHCRITPELKAQFVSQANKEGKKLCVWMLEKLSKS